MEGNLSQISSYFEQLSAQVCSLIEAGREQEVLIHPLKIRFTEIENGVEKIHQEFVNRIDGNV